MTLRAILRSERKEVRPHPSLKNFIILLGFLLTTPIAMLGAVIILFYIYRRIGGPLPEELIVVLFYALVFSFVVGFGLWAGKKRYLLFQEKQKNEGQIDSNISLKAELWETLTLFIWTILSLTGFYRFFLGETYRLPRAARLCMDYESSDVQLILAFSVVFVVFKRYRVLKNLIAKRLP